MRQQVLITDKSLLVPVLEIYYRMAHFFPFFTWGDGQRTARIASSKTILRPFWVNAEHSRYLTAPISFIICRPCGYVMGASFFSFNLSIVSLSSRRSSFVPTRTIGVLGQWWLTSGYHQKRVEIQFNFFNTITSLDRHSIIFTLARTFSNDAGLTSEKQIKNTSYNKKAPQYSIA